MSLASLLGIARSALLTYQRAMDVTGHNVANAQTPGYSRQRLQILAADPLYTPLGTLGLGVTDSGIIRARDRFLDATYRRDFGLLGNSTTLGDILGQVEAAMNEPSETGIAAALDNLFHSFGDLANDPPSTTNRNLVRQAAGRLVDQLHQLSAQISRAGEDAVERMRAQVDQVNSLATRIGELNQQILSAGGAGHTAPDLEDQRDLLVDQLSGMVAVRVVQHDDGTIAVLAGDSVLVDGALVRTLGMKLLAGGGYGIGPAAGAGIIDPQAGSLKALSDLTSTKLPGIQAQLDSFAQALVNEVNGIHRAGYTLTGATGTDFFDPAGVTAATIALAPGVAASGDAIAAGATAAPGDGDIALQLAGLGGRTIAALGGKTLRDYYTTLAGAVGSDVQGAAQDAATEQALAEQADAQRSSVNGVSIDEEMVALIAQQQAYGAAARLINVADQMMQDLMQVVGSRL